MATIDFSLKSGDTRPSIQATLTGADGSVAVLTGATARFKMRPVGGGALKVDAAAVIVTPASGVVRYDWVAADTDTPGQFYAEWECDFGGGLVQTFPNDRSLLVVITAAVG